MLLASLKYVRSGGGRNLSLTFGGLVLIIRSMTACAPSSRFSFAALRALLALLLASFLVGSCASPLVPSPHLTGEPRRELADDALIERLRADWSAMGDLRLDREAHFAAMARYNADLLTLLHRVRYDYARAREDGRPYEPQGFRFAMDAARPGLRLQDVYDDIVPAVDIDIDNLEEHYIAPGVGVPLVGIVPAEKVENARSLGPVFNIRTRGTVGTLTALLEFPRGGGRPCLRLIPRPRHECVAVGRMNYSLAGDFSASIEVYWNLTRVDEHRLLGLLRPQELRDVSGLSCIEAYNPDRIPVILTHGLMSSAGTFDNLVNRLMSDPEIRQNYQFWYFNYPTGVAWTVSAAQYRQALEDVRRQVDPQRRNRNWDNMVVMGHSMGGLITRYSQCLEPWNLLRGNGSIPTKSYGGYLQARYVDEPIPVPAYERLRKDYFFRPVRAGMVVYMATPHRGAPLARYRIVTSLSKLVRLPENILAEVVNLATLQEDTVFLNPEEMTAWFTSVNQLAPNSYSIRGLQGLALRNVPTHSIIGNDGDDDEPLARTSDGIVPYWSSHIPWGTEHIVPSGHSVQDAKETAVELNRLLRDYLKTPSVRRGRCEK